jgi:hypothetical protein
MAEHLDRVALVAGLLVAAVGVLLLLDAGGTLDLTLAAIGPIVAFVCGAVLLTLGLSRSG